MLEAVNSRRAFLLVGAAAGAAACGPQGGGAPDEGGDARGVDAQPRAEAGSDAGPEGGVDAAAEAGIDAAVEAGTDARADATAADATADSPGEAGMGAPPCGAGATSVGPASRYTTGEPVLFMSGGFHVVRDARGVFAISAVCTHAGCTVFAGNLDRGVMGFICPCHSSTFTLERANVSGPASRPLVHHPVCVRADGTLGVDANATVASSTRLAV